MSSTILRLLSLALAILLTDMVIAHFSPAIAESQCADKETLATFDKEPKHKAMAYSVKTGECWWWGGWESYKRAAREVLKYCNKKSGDCKIVDVTAELKRQRDQDTSDIKQAQTKLKELGLYSGKIDGKRGPGTIAAIKAFQRKRQIFESGELNTSTMYELSRANPSILAREALCRAALNSDKSSWDTRSNFATHVQEAQKRNLSVDDCRVAIGMSKLKMAMSEPNQSSGAEFQICMSALNVSKRDWDTKPQFSQNVQEAKRRGLSVDDCRVTIGLSRIAALEVSTVSQDGIENSSILSGLEKQALCGSALSANKNDWDARPLFLML